MEIWEYKNVEYTNILTYQHTQPLLWGGVIYLKTAVLILDSSLFYNKS